MSFFPNHGKSEIKNVIGAYICDQFSIEKVVTKAFDSQKGNVLATDNHVSKVSV